MALAVVGQGYRTMDARPWMQYISTFIVGLFFPTIVKSLYRMVAPPVEDAGPNKMYNLRHGVLNVRTSQTAMWMNMGYWRDQEEARDFQHACRALLMEVLTTAGLCSCATGSANFAAKHSTSHKLSTVNIVDIGFGCGDQSIALLGLHGVRSYVGITLDERQCAFARRRLQEKHLLTEHDPTSTGSSDRPHPLRQVFHADAAKPESWSDDIKDALNNSFLNRRPVETESNWLLGLDVLYHLSPSRRELFRYAHQDLHASVMAFDLLLPDPSEQRPTLLQSCFLRLISFATSSPYSNFITPDEYRRQLVDAGFAAKDIEIRDISQDVFRPLVAFMQWQDIQLRQFGMGIGVFHVARWMFGWWARSGLVRGCIVVARRTDKVRASD